MELSFRSGTQASKGILVGPDVDARVGRNAQQQHPARLNKMTSTED